MTTPITGSTNTPATLPPINNGEQATQGLEIPPPPADVQVSQMQTLFDQLYDQIEKEGFYYTRADLDEIKKPVADFTQGLEGKNERLGERRERITTMTLHIIQKLMERNDPELTFSALREICSCVEWNAVRWEAQVMLEYSRLFERLDELAYRRPFNPVAVG